jgi:branched-chain amino acid transport system permease protein
VRIPPAACRGLPEYADPTPALGSIAGSAAAAVLVGLVQVYAGFYAGSGAGLGQLGNMSVVLVLAVVLLVRPRGLLGRPT